MRRSLLGRAASVVVVAAIPAVMVSAADGSSVARVANSSIPKSVTVDWGTSWQSMDIQVYTPGTGWQFDGAYDTLTTINDGKLVPYLATSWKQAHNNKSATFTLRKGVKCHNGATLTPKDVAASLNRLFTVPKKTVSLPPDYGNGPLTATANERKWTVTIKTQSPFGALAAGTASDESGIICPNGLADPSKLQTGLYGSGPYEMVSNTPGVQVVLRRNPHWTWGPIVNGHQYTWKDLPAKQTWKIVPDPATIANNLVTGAADIAKLQGPAIARFVHSKTFRLVAVPLDWPVTLDFGFGAGHSTNDPALREAIELAVSRKNLEQAFYTGQGTKLPPAATSFVASSSPCYDKATSKLIPTGGLAKAKQVLSAAGYTGVGSKLTAPDGTPVTIKVATDPNQVNEAGPYLQQALAALGANVTLSNGSTLTFQQAVFGGNMDVTVSEGDSTSPTISNGYIPYLTGQSISGGGFNVFGPSASVDPYWSNLVTAAEGGSGCKQWDTAQMYMLKNYIAEPISETDWYYVARRNLKVRTGYRLIEPWTIN